MKIVNSKTHGLVLMREEEYRNLIPRGGPGPINPLTVDGIIIIDWDTFRATLDGVQLGQLSAFFEKQLGYKPTEHPSWDRRKIQPGAEVRGFIYDILFTELEETL